MLFSLGILALFCACDVSGFFLDNDPCELSVWPDNGIPESSDYTMSINVPSQCKNGTFRWDYPKGHVMVHFPNTNGMARKICFGESLGGDIFTVVDLTNGGNYTLPHFERDSSTEACTKPTSSGESLLRVDAPPTMYYMGAMTFDIQS